jgi:hypothetical protein
MPSTLVILPNHIEWANYVGQHDNIKLCLLRFNLNDKTLKV